jgi:hypothetical protein
MKKAAYMGAIGILAASVVAAVVVHRVHRDVYSVHIYSAGHVYGPSWQIGKPPNIYGFSEYVLTQDADGMVVFIPGDGVRKAVKFPTFTDLYFAGHRTTIRAPLWMVGAVMISALVAVIALAASASGRLFEKSKDADG